MDQNHSKKHSESFYILYKMVSQLSSKWAYFNQPVSQKLSTITDHSLIECNKFESVIAWIECNKIEN